MRKDNRILIISIFILICNSLASQNININYLKIYNDTIDFKTINEKMNCTSTKKVPIIENSYFVFNSDTVYLAPDTLPGFIEFDNYVKKNRVYPEPRTNLNFSSYIKVILDKDGEVVYAGALKISPDYRYEEYAIKLINEMPKWKPARLNNKNVSCIFTVTIPAGESKVSMIKR